MKKQKPKPDSNVSQAARALGKQRWAGKSPEERREHTRAMGRASAASRLKKAIRAAKKEAKNRRKK